ncbi:MAG: DNA-deoxyinosine glycosylase [Candidatus Wenzhouxiangella sp. M2_3B_020]
MLQEINDRFARGYHRIMRSDSSAGELLTGFPPVHDPDAEILVLGSMPGVRSLDAAEYYAHPRNAFWPIMERLLDVPAGADYAHRLAGLKSHRIALWDVIGRCRRTGSLDQRIEPDSIEANDFPALFSACPRIGRVLFNGGMAETAWRRHVAASLPDGIDPLECMRMPSTSPAFAAMTFERKCAAWRRGLEPVLPR